MGTIQHDAVLAVFWEDHDSAPFTDWRDTLPAEWQRLAIGPVAPIVNGGATYAWLPDGSKEGWDTSDQGDGFRKQFIEVMRSLAHYPAIFALSVGESGEWLTDVSEPSSEEKSDVLADCFYCHQRRRASGLSDALCDHCDDELGHVLHRLAGNPEGKGNE